VKAIVNTGAGRLEMLDRPVPEPGAGEVRIRTAACGICATDLAMIDGWERTGFPAIPGHEWSGVIDTVGAGVRRELVGRHCVAENGLSDGGEVGFEHPGGYAEYLVTEADKVHVLDKDFPAVEATLVEPLAVCIRARRRMRLRNRRPALIFGDGPVGLMMLILLRRTGVARVVLVGGRAERLALARELGAERTVNYHGTPDLSGEIGRTANDVFPNIVEASGSSEALALGLELAPPRGKILVLGDYGKARAAFRWNTILLQELELIGSNASAGAWREAVRLASTGELPLGRLVTHRLPADRFAEAMELVRNRSAGVVKAVLEWEKRT